MRIALITRRGILGQPRVLSTLQRALAICESFQMCVPLRIIVQKRYSENSQTGHSMENECLTTPQHTMDSE